MSARTDVLLWAQRVLARHDAAAHQILEIAAGAAADVAQESFHKIARMAHPDLHRTTLSSDELELVTTAYARAAAAYQEFRRQNSTTRLRPIRDAVAPPAPCQTTVVIPTSPMSNRAVAIPDDRPVVPAQAMSSKALIYYRKAELCLRRGDLAGAVLQLKMAIASDPQSAFLRSALAEVASELPKKP